MIYIHILCRQSMAIQCISLISFPLFTSTLSSPFELSLAYVDRFFSTFELSFHSYIDWKHPLNYLMRIKIKRLSPWQILIDFFRPSCLGFIRTWIQSTFNCPLPNKIKSKHFHFTLGKLRSIFHDLRVEASFAHGSRALSIAYCGSK